MVAPNAAGAGAGVVDSDHVLARLPTLYHGTDFAVGRFPSAPVRAQSHGNPTVSALDLEASHAQRTYNHIPC